MKRAAEGRASKVFYGWWIVVIAVLGLSVGYGPILVYTFSVFFKPVSEEFAWGRAETSLVFSLSLIVIGLSTFIMPSLAHFLITSFGWRTAYMLLGLLVIVVTVPVVWLFLKETPQSVGLMPDGENKADVMSGRKGMGPGGVCIREAVGSSTFWLMCEVFFLVSASINGCLITWCQCLRIETCLQAPRPSQPHFSGEQPSWAG